MSYCILAVDRYQWKDKWKPLILRGAKFISYFLFHSFVFPDSFVFRDSFVVRTGDQLLASTDFDCCWLSTSIY